ncbi:MAG: hypothetical protein OHK0038_03830 [Flammeovirgaceae bacterium]
MHKKKIVLASVLKPPDDVRMYEKLGKSLSEMYEVHLLGLQTTHSIVEDDVVKFYPIFQKDKNARISASWKFLKKVVEIKPDALIVCTIELLPIALWYCFLHPCMLIYDVQENYVYNVLYQNIYRKSLKYFLAIGIRMVEWISRLITTHYFLAEKTYQNELTFTRGKDTVLENKAVIPSHLLPTKQDFPKKINPKLFVYSGTISRVYGALDALNFLLKWRESDDKVCLLFIGRFAEKEVAEEILKNAILYPENIKLIGGNEWVSHAQILESLKKADLAILPYQPNRSTKDCIPTKLYECMAMGVPMLIRRNPLWEEICAPFHAAVFTNFNQNEVRQVMEKIQKTNFYPNGNAKMAFWESEKEKLLEVMRANQIQLHLNKKKKSKNYIL